MAQPENADFRWNCETLFCVEEFFKSASPEQWKTFCRLAAEGKIGLSANYLNFNDLVDCQVYGQRLAQWQARLEPYGAAMKTAMMADINGISMGYRDAMLENGVEFLFTNIHCHHGMYPLYQNQTAFFWENAAGKRLLVWNGEHYNLGNVLGIKPNRSANFMMRDRLGAETLPRIDFRLELGKTISSDIENVFLPLSLSLPDSQLYLRKGGQEAFRPGVDQLPGTCMEFYMSDDGLAYVSPEGSVLVATRDTPLVYMGQLCHHPIRLCDGRPENNGRPVYSWLMNNNWETNFKMDLSGFCEYCYSLWLGGETSPEEAMDALRENCFDPYVLVTE